MSSDIIVLKQSGVPGKIPQTKDLQFGELAINTFSGQIFAKRTDKVTEEIVTTSSNLMTSSKIEKPLNTFYINLDLSVKHSKELIIEGNTQLAFINPAKADETTTTTLFIFNAGDNAITWVNEIIWENGISPEIASDAWTIIEIISYNAGKRTFGIVKGTNLKEV